MDPTQLQQLVQLLQQNPSAMNGGFGGSGGTATPPPTQSQVLGPGSQPGMGTSPQSMAMMQGLMGTGLGQVPISGIAQQGY
jgi:hypothetical protein